MDTGDIIKFYSDFSKLKKVVRTGWTRHMPHEEVESVADHSFGVALLSTIISERYFPEADLTKIMKISLIHDLAEIHTGDITPFCGVSKEEKNKRERRAIHKIFSNIQNGEEFISLWEEYNNKSSIEAQIVKETDKLETCLQAKEYENEKGLNLSEFFKNSKDKITLKEIKEIFDSIRKE